MLASMEFNIKLNNHMYIFSFVLLHFYLIISSSLALVLAFLHFVRVTALFATNRHVGSGWLLHHLGSSVFFSPRATNPCSPGPPFWILISTVRHFVPTKVTATILWILESWSNLYYLKELYFLPTIKRWGRERGRERERGEGRARRGLPTRQGPLPAGSGCHSSSPPPPRDG